MHNLVRSLAWLLGLAIPLAAQNDLHMYAGGIAINPDEVVQGGLGGIGIGGLGLRTGRFYFAGDGHVLGLNSRGQANFRQRYAAGLEWRLASEIERRLRGEVGQQLAAQVSQRLGDALERRLAGQLGQPLATALRQTFEGDIEQQLASEIGQELASEIGQQLTGQIGQRLADEFGGRLPLKTYGFDASAGIAVLSNERVSLIPVGIAGYTRPELCEARACDVNRTRFNYGGGLVLTASGRGKRLGLHLGARYTHNYGAAVTAGLVVRLDAR